MSELTENIEKWMNEVKSDLIRNYELKGLKASGNWAKSLESKITETRATLYAAKYTGAIENGRAPTKNKGNGNVREMIRAWIDNKGIYPKPIIGDNGKLSKPMTKDQLSYAITNVIHKKGTKTFINKTTTNLVGGVINDNKIKELLTIVKEYMAGKIRSDILKPFMK